MNRDRTISAREIEGLIAKGSTIVIFEDFVLRLDSWLSRHPGGSLAIEHMIGRDATDEISVYHSLETCKTMRAFRIGRKPAGPWINMTPPIRGGVFTPYDVVQEEKPVVADADADADASKIDSDGALLLPEDKEGDKEKLLRRRTPSPAAAAAAATAFSPNKENINIPDRNNDDDEAWHVDGYPLCPEKYTDWAVQQEIDQGLATYPALDAATQQDIVAKYRNLHQQIRDEGLYECRYVEYGKEMARYSTLFALFLTALRYEWWMTSAVFLGLFWHQIMFTAHDAGHRAITKNFVVDTLIGMFVADFCCGLSIGWWKSSHNVHHLITNQPEHDPDIQNVPLFATCPSFFKSISSSYYNGFVFVWDKAAEILVPYQQYTYYPVMGIARFNLYLLSWLHVLSGKGSSLGSSKAWWIRPTEITFMACYWFIFGYCLLLRTLPTWTVRVAFVLVCHIITMPLHVQITLSHWGMSTSDLGEAESFPQRQLRTTMDVDCPAWLDFIHGGLQFQAIHHLFPRVPRHNLRRTQELVKEFSRETGIPYLTLNFLDGNKKVLSRLEEVSKQVKILVSCQKYMAETGESGLH